MENIYKLKKAEISKRMLFDMQPVLRKPSRSQNNATYYTVYRNVEVLNGKLRYDITVIPQKILDGEFTKTFGHYHKDKSPELYEVLEGRAYFLLQRYGVDPSAVEEACIVECAPGEKAIMPPGFGHLSINVGNEKLVLGNWIGLVEYDYETIKKFHGGCYYVLDSGGAVKFEKNPNYKSVPELKKLKLRDLPDLGIVNDSKHPILDLKKSPEKLEWFIKPEKYIDLLTIEKLYIEI